MLKILLYPFSILYRLVTGLRNYMYDQGLKPSASFDLPVISVGNLTVGGTGKTPMVEYIIRLLKNSHHIATLSRGYGRNTKGFHIAESVDSAITIGDEPMQFFKKFESEVIVAVGEERALAIPQILQEKSEVEVIILDDAFQHRRVKPSLSILLCDYNRPFYRDSPLPAGRLRESPFGAARADVVVVTKCPAKLSEEQQMDIQREISMFSEKPVFFCSISYGDAISFGKNVPLGKSIILVTGIANASPLKDFLKKNYTIIHHFNFKDHKVYHSADLEDISGLVRGYPEAAVITTEKDMVKLDRAEFSEYMRSIPFYYLPITVQFLKSGNDFDEIVRNHVTNQLQKKGV